MCEISRMPPELLKDLTFYSNDDLPAFRLQTLLIVLLVWRKKLLKKEAPPWYRLFKGFHTSEQILIPLTGLFVSPAPIKFTVVWFLMSVFFLSMEKIESTDATEGTGEEFPVNGTPVAETPSVVTGTPFDFAPLWKLIPLRAPLLPQPPYITAVLRSALLYCPEWGFIQEASQPDVCSSRGFFSLFLILFELSPKGGGHQSKQKTLSLSEVPQRRPRTSTAK